MKCNTIGSRAASEVLRLSIEKDVTLRQMTEQLGTNRQNWYRWNAGKTTPSAEILSALLIAGADIEWVLRGERV